MGRKKQTVASANKRLEMSQRPNVPQGDRLLLPPDPHSSTAMPRKRGWPKGRPRKKPLDQRLMVSFNKMVADAAPLVAVSEDGGGTPDLAPTLTKESLERRVSRRLNVLDKYLTDTKLHELLIMSSLKEIGIYEGIMMDKALVLKGQPNVIIGSDDRVKLNEVLPALLNEMRRRKLTTTVSERKIEFTGEIREAQPIRPESRPE